jgi:hypothetical protein
LGGGVTVIEPETTEVKPEAAKIRVAPVPR